MAWRVLIECEIKSLPINLNVIIKYYNIRVIFYSHSKLYKIFNPEKISEDGFATVINGQKTIFINDNIHTRGRRRFTLGHELGHVLLNHTLDDIIVPRKTYEYDDEMKPLEMQANVFSRDILAPACILNALGITTADKIMKICNISGISAEIRLERLIKLREQDKFLYSPLEQQVYKQFKGFIDNNRNYGVYHERY